LNQGKRIIRKNGKDYKMKKTQIATQLPVLNQTEAKSQNAITGSQSKTSESHGNQAGHRSKAGFLPPPSSLSLFFVLCSLFSVIWIACENPASDSNGTYTPPNPNVLNLKTTDNVDATLTFAATTRAEDVEYYNYTLTVNNIGRSAGSAEVSRAIDNSLQIDFTSAGGTTFTARISTANKFSFTGGEYNIEIELEDAEFPVVFQSNAAMPQNHTIGATLPPAPVAVSPHTAGVGQGKTRPFSASVYGETDQNVTWSLETAAEITLKPGTAIITGTGVLSVAADETVGTVITVKAVSSANGKTGTAEVTVTREQLLIQPETVNLTKHGSMFQFTVSEPDGAVFWSVEDPKVYGTSIDPENGYLSISADETAPSLTVKAVSASDNQKFGTAVVTIVPPNGVTISPHNPSIARGTAQEFTAPVSADTPDGHIPPQAVKWTLSGAGSGNTKLMVSGSNIAVNANNYYSVPVTLTIAPDESSPTLTLGAVSNGGTASDSITVTVLGIGDITAVEDISFSTTTGVAGFQVNLSGASAPSVSPANATYKTVVWSIKSGDTTGAALYTNYVTPASAGTLTLVATIANGASAGVAFAKEFPITVAAFVAVTNITGGPSGGTANNEITLSGTVEPANATYQTIVWSVTTAGAGLGTGTVSGTVTPTSAGTPVLRARIANGTAANAAYDQYFNITVTPPVEIPDGFIEISTVADLKKIGSEYSLNGKYIQTQDINLNGENWTPIGIGPETTVANHFTGTFDGNGKTITNLTVNYSAEGAGLFGFIGIGGLVKNIIVGSGSSVTNSNDGSTGGISGYSNGSIENCVNNAAISGKSNVGGIVGTGGNASKVTGSHNKANVTGTASNIGGIVGTGATEVTSCSNIGAVESTHTGANGCAGGIVGNSSAKITACYNKGSVRLISGTTAPRVGGIAGTSGAGCEITACYNEGAVSAAGSNNATETNSVKVGGIVGTTNNSNTNACYNIGTVTGSSSGSTKVVYAGGVIGYISVASNTTTACYWKDDESDTAIKGIGYIKTGTAEGVDDNAQKFASGTWPAHNAATGWGSGTSTTGEDSKYWKSLGLWSSSPTYPKLWFE
jgi:hypothetical protein